jgi:hypothetical protein
MSATLKEAIAAALNWRKDADTTSDEWEEVAVGWDCKHAFETDFDGKEICETLSLYRTELAPGGTVTDTSNCAWGAKFVTLPERHPLYFPSPVSRYSPRVCIQDNIDEPGGLILSFLNGDTPFISVHFDSSDDLKVLRRLLNAWGES